MLPQVQEKVREGRKGYSKWPGVWATPRTLRWEFWKEGLHFKVAAEARWLNGRKSPRPR